MGDHADVQEMTSPIRAIRRELLACSPNRRAVSHSSLVHSTAQLIAGIKAIETCSLNVLVPPIYDHEQHSDMKSRKGEVQSKSHVGGKDDGREEGTEKSKSTSPAKTALHPTRTIAFTARERSVLLELNETHSFS